MVHPMDASATYSMEYLFCEWGIRWAEYFWRCSNTLKMQVFLGTDMTVQKFNKTLIFVDIVVMKKGPQMYHSSNLLTAIKERNSIDVIVPKRHGFYAFIHFIVWEAHAIRILFECMLIFFLYQLICAYSVSSGLAPFPPSIHVSILSCITLIVLYLDTQILCKAHGTFKKAFIKSYSGNLERAIELASEASINKIPPSSMEYHLALSQFHLLQGSSEIGDTFLESAMRHGADPFDCIYLRMRSLFFSGKSQESLEGITAYLDKSPLLKLEYGIIKTVSDDSSFEARETLKQILNQESVLHPSGAESHDLAGLMLACIDLRSGKAEEALPRIQMILEVITPELRLFPNLRPYIALVYLEKAKYYSRKSLYKMRAQFDTDRALSICSYPLHTQIADSM
jgi:tetratricopeptide (TPR) repeat protein